MKESQDNTKSDVLILCCYCKRSLYDIKTSREMSEDDLLETHLKKSHTICPDCLLHNYPKEYLAIQEKKRVRIRNSFFRTYGEF